MLLENKRDILRIVVFNNEFAKIMKLEEFHVQSKHKNVYQNESWLEVYD